MWQQEEEGPSKEVSQQDGQYRAEIGEGGKVYQDRRACALAHTTCATMLSPSSPTDMLPFSPWTCAI